MTFLAIFYETSYWLSLLAAVSLAGLAFLLRNTYRGVHPGLRGFSIPMPVDGLALIDRGQSRGWRRVYSHRQYWRLMSLLPMYLCLLLAAVVDWERWRIWSAFAAISLTPLLITPSRRAWFGLVIPILGAGVLTWNGFITSTRLPPGNWTRPWSSTFCTARIVLSGDGSAWCIDHNLDRINRFHISTSLILEQYPVASQRVLFAAHTDGAWITGAGVRGLIYVSRGQVKPIWWRSNRPVDGNVSADGRLWFVDRYHRLNIYSRSGETLSLGTGDGLLNNLAYSVEVFPDQSIWVGTMRGASRRDAQTGEWGVVQWGSGPNGAVTDIEVGPDGTIWFLQTFTLPLGLQALLVSGLRADGQFMHYDLHKNTSLIVPSVPRDAIAVDGLGRLWFTGVSSVLSEKQLGILNPDGSLAMPLVSLGPFKPGNIFGVVADGDGGVFLYNQGSDPLRHWRP